MNYDEVNGDSVYGKKKDEILKYLLFKRNKGYYGNTAESGLVLTTLLPELLKNNIDKKSRKTEVYISGAIKDTVSTFPAYYSLNNKTPQFYFQKKVSLLHTYLLIMSISINSLKNVMALSKCKPLL